MNKFTKLLLRVFVILLLVVVVLGGLSVKNALGPSDKTTETKFELSGSIKDTLYKLKEEGVINNADIAYYYIRLFKKDVSFLAGDFTIPAGLDLDGVIAYLSDSRNLEYDTVTVTFIEGDWCKHIARTISENTNLSYDELMEYWNDPDVYRFYQTKYPFLTDENLNENVKILMEGYLFPDTYNFYRDTTKEAVTETILNRTMEIYRKFEDDFNNSDLTINEIFTLASIIQYESGSIKDMPTIASVFFNRLNDPNWGYLESSVTRCYVIGQERDDDWRKCEVTLDYNDPYDTYANPGLPPGPILNPGEDAIYSVLHPADSDYYFFIGVNGVTYFARDINEHEYNIATYLNGN